MRNTKSFFLSGAAKDQGYINIRDLPRFSNARNFIEQLWIKFQPYADSNFKEKARNQFLQRFWEMYLGATFLSYGYSFGKVSDKGPEFFIEIGGKRIWIEAIAPLSGTGSDAVPELSAVTPDIAQEVPEEKILLRFTHAIKEKFEKYIKDANKEIIKPHDSYIIAINGKGIRSVLADGTIPYVVKSVLPFGGLVAEIDKSGNIADAFYSFRDTVVKNSGTPISTAMFLDESYNGITGLLYSGVDALNYHDDIGSDFICLHNPLALNPIPRRTFQFCREYWLEGQELKQWDWRINSQSDNKN